MSVPTAQGLLVSFGSTSLGRIIGFGEQFAAGSPYDLTHVASTIIGTGANTRVVRQLEPTMIEPGTFTLRLLGYVSLTRSDCGKIDTLTISQGGSSVALTAYVAEVQFEGNRGELIQSSVSFQFTGAD